MTSFYDSDRDFCICMCLFASQVIISLSFWIIEIFFSFETVIEHDIFMCAMYVLLLFTVCACNKCYEKYYSYPEWNSYYNYSLIFITKKLWSKFRDRKHIVKQLMFLNPCAYLVREVFLINIYIGIITVIVSGIIWGYLIKDPDHWDNGEPVK